MRNATSAAIGLALALGIGLVACGCSRKPNPEAVAQLEEMSSTVQGMGIVVSAGVTEDQYSERLTDALLKLGNPGDRCKQAISKLARQDQQAQASDICHRLAEAMDAYVRAKEYFGARIDPITPDLPLYTVKEEDYAVVKAQFPMLEDLPVSETNTVGYKFYRRSAMLQALWKVAGQDSQAAADLLEKLTQS